MTYFRTEKASRNRTNVYDVATGELLCQLRANEVERWVRNSTKARDDDVTYRAEARARRLEIAREYLAVRAARASASQLSMF